MKSIKLDLEEGLHRRLKVWSFKNGYTMQSALRYMIGEKVGHDERDAELNHSTINKHTKPTCRYGVDLPR